MISTGFKTCFYLRAFELARDGFTDAQICEALDIRAADLRKWKRDNHDFRDALERGAAEYKRSTERATVNMDGLTEKQRRFCLEYLVDFSLQKAAIRSGYAESGAAKMGTELLRNPVVAEFLTRELQKMHHRNEITVERLLREVAYIAFSDIRELFDETGTLRDIHKLPDSVARAVSSVEVVSSTDKKGITTTTAKIKLWNKLQAHELLAKHLGLLKEAGTLGDRRPDDGVLLELLNRVEQAMHDQTRVVDQRYIEQEAEKHLTLDGVSTPTPGG